MTSKLLMAFVLLLALAGIANALPTNNSIYIDRNFLEWTADEAPDINLLSTGALYAKLSCDNASWSNVLAFTAVIKDFNLASGSNGCSMSDANKTVYAQFSDDNATWTSSVNHFVRFDSTAPPIPENVKIIQKYNQFEISWDESVDPDPGIGTAYYKLFKGTGPSPRRAYKLITTGYTVYRDRETVDTTETYYYAVSAVDNLGNDSNKSEPIGITLDLSPPVLDVGFRGLAVFRAAYYIAPGTYILDINSNEPLSAIDGNILLPDGNYQKISFTGSGTKFSSSFGIPEIMGVAKLNVLATDVVGLSARLLMQLNIAKEVPDINFFSPAEEYIEGMAHLKAKSLKAAKVIFYYRNLDLKQPWIQLAEMQASEARDYVFSFDLNFLGKGDENFVTGNYEVKAVALDALGNAAEEIKKVYFYNEPLERYSLKQEIQALGLISETLSGKLAESIKNYFIPEELTKLKQSADLKVSNAIKALNDNKLAESKQLLSEARQEYDALGQALFAQKGFIPIQQIFSLKAVSGMAFLLLLFAFFIVLAASALSMYKLHEQRKYPLKEIKKPAEKKRLLSYLERKKLP